MVPVGHPLSSVKNEFNAILFTGSTNDTLEFYGKGAGSIPTATAIVSDLVSILENRAYIDYKNENKLNVNKSMTNNATYYVVDKIKNEEHSKKKTYDSFYKLLMEPKDVLKDTIKQLIENDTSSTAIQSSVTETSNLKSTAIASTEELSGTWGGEENINKIVIMRGGRGFVIFNNGASMNITVELSGADSAKKVVVTQKGNSNASFYPELKRTAALSAAVSAKPIKWTLSLTDNNTLKGTKDTLLPDGDDFMEGSVSVVWTRLN
jgi:hypothetical protein